MKPFALWKTLLLLVAVTFGAIYAAPNLYGEDLAVQISAEDSADLDSVFGDQVSRILGERGLQAKSSQIELGRWIVRMPDAESQLQAADALRRDLGRGYQVALNLAPKTPQWLIDLGAQPMALGLDLRGGVHFLLEVDVEDAMATSMKRALKDVPAHLRKQDIRYSGRRQEGSSIVLEFPDEQRLEAAQNEIRSEFSELQIEPGENSLALRLSLSEAEAKRIQDFAVRQNLTTLRNRVNELGVAEPLVQRQGANRIVVQLPGVQDTARAKGLLQTTATLEYRAVVGEGSEAQSAAATGAVPYGTELYYYVREGNRPVLVKDEIIASGDQLVDAQAGIDSESGSPNVSVTLDGAGAKRMYAFTESNVGKPMAVLFRENEVVTTYNAKGEAVRERRQIEEIISIANIRGVFGKRFQTTGLTTAEAQNLAILLRAGALAAPVEIVEERTVGPSLGKDNIAQGVTAAAVGFGLVVIFMLLYYRVFGFIANLALMLNVLLLVAVMSLLQATLTLPGIAGIVLTMGMAVDANVLIFERIREELARNQSPHQAIESGYDRAFLTIADANITTLIAAIMLFALGSGPIKGFAVTLSIGILTSMFTSIMGTRAVVHLLFSRRRLSDLPV